MKINIDEIAFCEISDCSRIASIVAYDKHEDKLGGYCRPHGEGIVDRSNPEYKVNCPNCECQFGVN